MAALLDLIERSRSWDEETLAQADPLFLLLRARLLKRFDDKKVANGAACVCGHANAKA